MNKSIFNDGKYDDEMLHQLNMVYRKTTNFKMERKQKQKKKHIFDLKN